MSRIGLIGLPHNACHHRTAASDADFKFDPDLPFRCMRLLAGHLGVLMSVEVFGYIFRQRESFTATPKSQHIQFVWPFQNKSRDICRVNGWLASDQRLESVRSKVRIIVVQLTKQEFS